MKSYINIYKHKKTYDDDVMMSFLLQASTQRFLYKFVWRKSWNRLRLRLPSIQKEEERHSMVSLRLLLKSFRLLKSLRLAHRVWRVTMDSSTLKRNRRCGSFSSRHDVQSGGLSPQCFIDWKHSNYITVLLPAKVVYTYLYMVIGWIPPNMYIYIYIYVKIGWIPPNVYTYIYKL